MTLTQTQRLHLERRLHDERVRLLRMLNRSVADSANATEEERAGDISAMPTHAADLGTDTMDEELDASNASRMSYELGEIDAALERMYKHPDKFGICEDTGADIPFARLDIIPWARNCGEEAS